MTDFVTASVYVENLHLFIGHRIWSKPESMGYATYGYHILVDVITEETGSMYYPVRIKAVIEYEGERHEVNTAKVCTVQNVEKDQCTSIDYDGTKWWQWNPPAQQLSIF